MPYLSTPPIGLEYVDDYRPSNAEMGRRFKSMSVTENTMIRPSKADMAGIYTDFSDSLSDRSWAMHKQNVALYRNARLGDKRSVAASLIVLAGGAIQDGNYLSARTHFAEALALFRSLKDHRSLSYVLERFARLVCLKGNCEAAARILGAASALREITNAQPQAHERDELDEDLFTLTEALGEEAFTAAWKEGQYMTAEQAIEYALKYSR